MSVRNRGYNHVEQGTTVVPTTTKPVYNHVYTRDNTSPRDAGMILGKPALYNSVVTQVITPVIYLVPKPYMDLFATLS